MRASDNQSPFSDKSLIFLTPRLKPICLRHENEYMLCIAAVIFTISFYKSAHINVFQCDFPDFIVLLLYARLLKDLGHDIVTPGLISISILCKVS